MATQRLRPLGFHAGGIVMTENLASAIIVSVVCICLTTCAVGGQALSQQQRQFEILHPKPVKPVCIERKMLRCITWHPALKG